nr:UDP-N-acetylmuramate dehydrogenase [uncultured Moellerella sp.]
MTLSIELKPINTFGISARAHALFCADSVTSLHALWLEAQANNEPVLLLGAGSNVLFTDNFHGMIILNRIKGINIKETATDWHIYAGAGENWHQLIEYLIDNSVYGLENLALIPGCVGSAPIQNIGAYGVELKDVCEYVEVMALNSGEIIRFTAADCQFGYRDSIFKHQYRDGYVIVGVGLKLAKAWKPILTYGDLSRFDINTVTAQDIFNSVCATRRAKLPDPADIGNAGSFFKNPLVTAALAEQIYEQYPLCPQYAQPDGQIKLAAGWLIDHCGLKGEQVGGAAVHTKQALVLINKDNATGQDVIALAAKIRECVQERFNVLLEPEVRFIGTNGEIDAVRSIS